MRDTGNRYWYFKSCMRIEIYRKTYNVMAFAISVVLVSLSPCEASDRNGAYYGMSDVSSCGNYDADRKSPDTMGNTVAQYFVDGWLTAYNAIVPETFDIKGDTDLNSIMLWLDNYCRNNPLSSVPTGMLLLAHELYPKRLIIAPKSHTH